jgi:hypothetical protein
MGYVKKKLCESKSKSVLPSQCCKDTMAHELDVFLPDDNCKEFEGLKSIIARLVELVEYSNW